MLVPDRTCGSCNVCCIVPKIDEPALQKLPGCRCPNALLDGSCRIYETRPQTCRDFFCAWRILPWVDERLKPDRSAIFMRLTGDATLVVGPHRFALMVTVLSHDGLDAPGLADTIITAIEAGIDTYLVVPGPPGYTSCRKRLNRALAEVVKGGDAKALRDAMERQYAEARAKLSETRPVVLTTSSS